MKVNDSIELLEIGTRVILKDAWYRALPPVYRCEGVIVSIETNNKTDGVEVLFDSGAPLFVNPKIIKKV